MDLKNILKEKTKLPVAEDHFLKPPKMPYIVFTKEEKITGISKNNLIIKSDVSIELYLEFPDVKIEEIIKNTIIDILKQNSFNDDEIEIYQNMTYINEEQMYEISFDFDLIEKRRELSHGKKN